MTIEIQCFSMFSEAKTFAMEPVTGSAETDTPSNLHVDPEEEFEFKILLQPKGDLFLHQVHSICFCSFQDHFLCTEVSKFCRVNNPLVQLNI